MPRGEQSPADLRWLQEHAWPLWLAHGVDWKARAFHEHLDLDSLGCDATFRRLRVAARQTYVFAKAAAFGLRDAKAATSLGIEFLLRSARLPDGGFAWRFDLDNRATDLTRDLYDHAFVLLAFASAAEVLGGDELRKDANALIAYIWRNFADRGLGYRESIPGVLPRRQNPHMHLFEALLAAYDAFGDEIFFIRAAELAALLVSHFFQREAGALPELFDAQLRPLYEMGRFRVEPGHHYEWIWLLDWYHRTRLMRAEPALPELEAVMVALLGFADRHAVHGSLGLVMNGLWSDGRVQDGDFRLWPQTERLKAEARRKDGAYENLSKARHALGKHMIGVRPGLWVERIDSLGRPIVGPAPATSLYHLTAALTDGLVLSASSAAQPSPR